MRGRVTHLSCCIHGVQVPSLGGTVEGGVSLNEIAAANLQVPRAACKGEAVKRDGPRKEGEQRLTAVPSIYMRPML